MKMIKNTLLTFSLFLFSRTVFAALPSYAQGGDVGSQLEEKGLLITDTVTLIAGIVGVVAIAGSAIYFSSGNSDKGKQFLVGGLVGIFISGAVYGIASVVG
ncbi:MAG: hypothetical protein COC14_00200 [Burkholderiaceae bacterium]|nr:MAG: hypothetical protein COC14_00200 [Burkholderiaceae bacterium]